MIEQWSLYLKYKVKAHLLAGPQKRPEGGIEPLRLSSATGLKPALRTTEGHRGKRLRVSCQSNESSS